MKKIDFYLLNLIACLFLSQQISASTEPLKFFDCVVDGSQLRPLKILMAEDTFLSQLLLEKMVKDASKDSGVPMKLAMADDGDHALKEFVQSMKSFDTIYRIIITDRTMKKMHGDELVQIIRRELAFSTDFPTDLIQVALQTSDKLQEKSPKLRSMSVSSKAASDGNKSPTNRKSSLPLTLKETYESEDATVSIEAQKLFDIIFKKTEYKLLKAWLVEQAKQYKSAQIKDSK